MKLVNEDFLHFLFKLKSFLVRKVSPFHCFQVRVESGVGALGRADSHGGEVELVDGVGGDRRHHLYGSADLDDDDDGGDDGNLDNHRRRHPRADGPPHQVASSYKSSHDAQDPDNPGKLGLRR